MAKDSLSDRACTVNDPPSAFSPSTQNPPQDYLDWSDYVRDNLGKARALVTVAQWGNGLNSCPESIQHDYLSVLDELLEGAVKGMDALQNFPQGK